MNLACRLGGQGLQNIDNSLTKRLRLGNTNTENSIYSIWLTILSSFLHDGKTKSPRRLVKDGDHHCCRNHNHTYYHWSIVPVPAHCKTYSSWSRRTLRQIPPFCQPRYRLSCSIR